MIIYKDRITGDELFTDAQKLRISEDGTCICFDTKLVTQKEGEIDGSLLGANASQEEQTEDCEVTTITGFDFVIANRLKEMSIPDKKTCQLYFKDFFKALIEKVKESTPEREEEVKTMAKKFVNNWVPKYNDVSFFVGESNPMNGNACIIVWNADGVSGVVHVLKEGLIEEKV